MKNNIAAFAIVIVIGILGYSVLENMPLEDSILSTTAILTTIAMPEGLSTQGKIFTIAFMAASGLLIAVTIVNLFQLYAKRDEEAVTGFFDAEEGNIGMIMKEMKVTAGSRFAGKTKAQILEQYGIVVVGVKRKNGFDINVPLNSKVKANSPVLVLGSAAKLMNVTVSKPASKSTSKSKRNSRRGTVRKR